MTEEQGKTKAQELKTRLRTEAETATDQMRGKFVALRFEDLKFIELQIDFLLREHFSKAQ
jgi:hypothetical protein